jgi:hypothetical protein
LSSSRKIGGSGESTFPADSGGYAALSRRKQPPIISRDATLVSLIQEPKKSK